MTFSCPTDHTRRLNNLPCLKNPTFVFCRNQKEGGDTSLYVGTGDVISPKMSLCLDYLTRLYTSLSKIT